MPANNDLLYSKLVFISSVLYFNIAGSTKLGILLMYHRIFKIDRTFHVQLVIVSFLVVSWWISCTIASLTTCIPLELLWFNPNIPDPQHCFNFNIFWMISGICEMVIHIAVLALPVRVTLSLHLSIRKKVSVACIFLLSGL